MQSAKQIISQAGLRSTKAREAVLDTILNTDNALNHTEVLSQVSAQHDIDRVTVYRVLDWLTAHQFIHKISGHDRAWRFQKTQHNDTQHDHADAHAHLHCKQCGKVVCIHELSPALSPRLLDKYQVSEVQINIEGVCPSCVAPAEQD